MIAVVSLLLNGLKIKVFLILFDETVLIFINKIVTNVKYVPFNFNIFFKQ